VPGEQREEFVILRPFVPVSKGNALQNLAAFMVARSGPNQYGRLESFDMPRGSDTVWGPVQVNNTILNTDAISREFTLLNQQGSSVVQGSLQLLPIEDSLIYIRPIYVVSRSGRQPAFRFVVVFYGGVAKLGTSVEDALAQFDDFRGIAPPNPGGPETPPSTTPGQSTRTAADILAEARQVYDDAQAALKAGNFARYGELTQQLDDLLEEAADALNGGRDGASQTSPLTSTTTRPSTTTTTAPDRERGSQALGARR
jgi:uncharacterized membrane protein (UPF0182 family)